ncbi:hypothetical protein GCM10011380_24000 [Sphingomonas metalli]|uniref:DUF885 domain-containing protein n=1 Tax=Sphingomonas metalli TaxID=1779358 RepID=A0A916T6Q6_9SPHN|nr:DUF885 family protein [Sphingomonas metalli]GGB33734.1 hypothetical protein GCM10011380_24000 [Sphingomonas metalli]
MLTTRRELLAGAGALGMSAVLPAQTGGAPGDASVRAKLDTVAEQLLADHPENALSLGIDTGARAALHGRFTDRSAAAEAARAARARTRLAELRAIDRKALSPATALDLDVTQAAHELAVAGWSAMPVGDVSVFNTGFRNTPYLVSQLGGAYSDLPDLLENRHAVKNAADADAYLSRIEAYATGLDQETQRIAADAAKGAILPGFLIDITRGQIEGIRTTPVADWGMIASFREKCAAAGLPASYAARATALATEKVVPALGRQAAQFAALRPRASDVPGIWARPGGEGWYRWLTQVATTTTRSPDDLHAIGVEQNRALNAQIDALLKGQGLTQGSVGARLAALGKRPDLLFANDDAGRAKLLAYVEGRVADMRQRLPRAFNTLVPGKLIVKRVPPAIQNGAPNGYAGPGSMDGSQPGIYYINLKDTGIWPRYSLPTLTYHEGIPGHVWQGEYSFRLPLIRSLLAFNAYSEGWALYAEQLGSELGAYEGDPLGQIGFLQSMNFRACRLVVDTGIHAKRWTFDQALRWFQEGTGMTSAQLTSELQRYCAMPGQACGYKVGHNEINRLRTKAQGALGSRYDLRAFDDVVVKTGNVPLTLLESVVDRYIAGA